MTCIDKNDRPKIAEQLTTVFIDYKERINAHWNLTQNKNRNFVFDHELLTSEEIKKFDSNIPPVWFGNLTINIVRKIFKQPSINSFEFL